METSIFLAQLMGPVLLVAAIGVLMNRPSQRAMALEFLASPPLIYISGAIIMTAGLAIVLYHNVWTADWRVIITLFGWMAMVGGAVRLLFFDYVQRIGKAMLDKPWTARGAGVVWLVVAAVLCYFGYFA